MTKQFNSFGFVVLALLTLGVASGEAALGIGSESRSSRRWVVGKEAVLDAREETVSLRLETPDDLRIGQQLVVFRLVPATNGALRFGGLRFERKRVARLEVVDIVDGEAHARIVAGKPKQRDAVRPHDSGPEDPLRA